VLTAHLTCPELAVADASGSVSQIGPSLTLPAL